MYFSNCATRSGCLNDISVGSQPVLLIFHFRKRATLTFRFMCISTTAELGPYSIQDGARWNSGVLMLAVGLYQSTSGCSAAHQPFCSQTAFALVGDDFKCKQNPQKSRANNLYIVGSEFYCLSAEGKFVEGNLFSSLLVFSMYLLIGERLNLGSFYIDLNRGIGLNFFSP